MQVRRLSRRLRPLEEGLLLTMLAMGAVFLVLAFFSSELYFTVDEPTYLVLHTLMEIASILVSFAVFIVNWEASKQNRNVQSVFVATGFLTVAVVDVMHTLSYSVMQAFVTPNGAEKAIYYWLFARYWAVAVIFAATFVRPDAAAWYLQRYLLVAVNLIAGCAVFVAVTFFAANLPLMYVDGVGLTPLKTGLEYGIVFLSVAAAVLTTRKYRATGDGLLVVLVTALVAGSFCEIALTLYRSPYDVYNLLGHAYKVVAYYLIFRAYLVSSVERPYIQLRKANEELERTVDKLNERTRELDALDEVALTLSSSLKPEELLPSAIEKVMAVTQAEAGAIFLVEPGTDELKLVAWRGLKGSFVAQYQAHSVRLPNSITTQRAPVQRTSLEDAGLFRSLGGDAARLAPLRACVCAPVTTKGELLGTIAMIAESSHAFSPTDVDLLTAMGYQLGLAIENSRLYEKTDERLQENLLELQQAERKARFLAEASGLLASSMELSKVLELVARKSTEVVGDWCAIYLLDERERVLRLEAVHHSDEEELIAVRRLLGRRALPEGEGVVGKVAATGEAVLVTGEMLQAFTTDLRSMVESVDEVAMLHRISPSSVIVSPMRARGQTVGALVVLQTHSSQALGDAEMALVSELGDRTGVAIENSRLFQESQEQRRHMEAVISQMVDGVVIADAYGKVLVANGAAQEMLRGEIPHLLDGSGWNGNERAKGAESAPQMPLIARALAGEVLTGEEFLVAGELGERVLNASVTPVREDDGAISGAVAVLRDVTAEREVDRMKDEFVATVSHELRTPITAVLGYTDLLLRGLRGPLSTSQTEAMTSIRNAGRRLLTLIEDLLDISKLEAGKQELNLDVVSVPSAVDRALSSVAFMASSKQVRLVEAIPASLPLVLADDAQLQRILGNLLSNAIKFTREGGTITVAAAPSAGDRRVDNLMRSDSQHFRWVIVTVSDTGVGIPPEMQSKIWNKFQQVDSSSSRTFGGTGLGLAITKALVELHGGTVWVESDGVPGKGSTFGFGLPAVATASRSE